MWGCGGGLWWDWWGLGEVEGRRDCSSVMLDSISDRADAWSLSCCSRSARSRRRRLISSSWEGGRERLLLRIVPTGVSSKSSSNLESGLGRFLEAGLPFAGILAGAFTTFFPGSPIGVFPGPMLLPSLPGVGLGAYRGVAGPPFENFGAPKEGRPDGVAAFAFWAFRRGDSGRGRESRGFGLSAGLAALAGPTDLFNLETAGVGVLSAFLSPLPPALKVASEGVVGVGGNESDDGAGETRL